MNSNDLMTSETRNLINEDTFGKMEKVYTYLKEQGVKVATYDTTTTSCGSCGNWSSKQKCS
jgi:hypothetical protein